MPYEIRVRPVTRFVVTEYYEEEHCGNSEGVGEFDNERKANEACEARAAWRAAQGAPASAHPLKSEENGCWWCPVEMAISPSGKGTMRVMSTPAPDLSKMTVTSTTAACFPEGPTAGSGE